MEARGEIRGGRFIRGVAGEQFTSSETVLALRKLRDESDRIEVVVCAAADPVNLAGIITPGTRIPSQAGNRVAFVNGVLSADWQGGKITWHAGVTDDLRLRIRDRLLHGVESKRRAAATDQSLTPKPEAMQSRIPSDKDSPASSTDEAAPHRLHVRISQSRPAPPSGVPRPRF
jgi:hypothetical protein